MERGGRLESSATIENMEQMSGGAWEVRFLNQDKLTKIINFDRLIVTTATKTFLKIFPILPSDYRIKLDSIDYISAQILILVLSKRLSKNYWMNIGDYNYPFLVVGEQSNLLGLDYYKGHSIVYLGNYLGDKDPRLSMSEEELVNLYEPFLKKINPSFSKSWIDKTIKFIGPYAQPIVDAEYKSKIPPFEVSGFRGLYYATMAQVYPWDRGVNYAVKLATDLVSKYF